jgi:hypothetical protein
VLDALVVEDVDVPALRIRHVQVVRREHRIDRDVGLTSTDPGFYQPGMIGSNFVEFGGDPSAGVHRMYISDNSRHIYAFTITG